MLDKNLTQKKIEGLTEVSGLLDKAIDAYERVLQYWPDSTQWITTEYIEPLRFSKYEADLEVKYLAELLIKE